MSSPDPLADILANCRAAMRASAEARSIIEACIADLEAVSASLPHGIGELKDSQAPAEQPLCASAP